MNSKPTLKLDWCSHEAAKYAVEHWHYSKRMPKSKLAKIGVWENGKFVGCVIYGLGATNNIGRPFGLRQQQVCELVRVALKNHNTPTSRIVSISIRMLSKEFSGLELVVSYADANQGHVGTLYQACGWHYIGMAKDAGGSAVVNGVEYHGRTLGDRYGTRSLAWIRANIDPNAKALESIGKYKYAMPLTDRMKEKIERMSKPYPKRVVSIDSDAPVFQAGEGGAIPTTTLHFQNREVA